MITKTIFNVMSTPTLDMVVGGTSSDEVHRRINAQWNHGNSVFGVDGDMFAKPFDEFRRVFVNAQRNTAHLLNTAWDIINDNTEIKPIVTLDDLAHVPACMYVPLLTYEPIRKLFAEGDIYGWGLQNKDLPDDDTHGRSIDFGFIGSDPETNLCPDEVTWEWQEGDPIYSADESVDIRESRWFLEMFINEQLKTDRFDPTDYLDGGLIGGLAV